MTSLHSRSALQTVSDDARSISSRASSPPPAQAVPPWRRLLFAHGQPVPRLLTNAALSDLCDDLIYELLGLISREHILPWYSRLTRDRTFLYEVVRIASYVIRDLEQRLGQANLVQIIAVDLPVVLERHIRTYRMAEQVQGTLQGGGMTRAQLFHSMQPHLAIIGDAAGEKLDIVDPIYLSTLVDRILVLCLPTEDSSAETERAVIRDVVVYVVLAGMLSKLTQPWFIHQTILSLLKAQSLRRRPKEDISIWLTFLNAILWTLTTLTSIFSCLADWASAPTWMTVPTDIDLTRPSIELVSTAFHCEDRAPLGYAIWLINCMTSVFGATCDALVTWQIEARLLNGEVLATALRAARDTLFPGGKAAPHAPDPTPSEQAELKEAVEKALGYLMPESILAIVLPATEAAHRRHVLVSDLLEPFSMAEINVHLALTMMDLLVARVFPELLADAQGVPA